MEEMATLKDLNTGYCKYKNIYALKNSLKMVEAAYPSMALPVDKIPVYPFFPGWHGEYNHFVYLEEILDYLARMQILSPETLTRLSRTQK